MTLFSITIASSAARNACAFPSFSLGFKHIVAEQNSMHGADRSGSYGEFAQKKRHIVDDIGTQRGSDGNREETAVVYTVLLLHRLDNSYGSCV